jgi:hypothetical protein
MRAGGMWIMAVVERTRHRLRYSCVPKVSTASASISILYIHTFRSLLNGATVPWFSLLRQPRTFEFQARAADGTIHDFEIQASTAQSALDLAKRLCAAKGWQLLHALDGQ